VKPGKSRPQLNWALFLTDDVTAYGIGQGHYFMGLNPFPPSRTGEELIESFGDPSAVRDDDTKVLANVADVPPAPDDRVAGDPARRLYWLQTIILNWSGYTNGRIKFEGAAYPLPSRPARWRNCAMAMETNRGDG
jgi:hypothetical protein